MDRNIVNDLDLGLGQIQWQRFIEMWMTILFVLNTRQPGEPETKALRRAFSNLCIEYDYLQLGYLPPSQ
jgi:hypothetical protein